MVVISDTSARVSDIGGSAISLVALVELVEKKPNRARHKNIFNDAPQARRQALVPKMCWRSRLALNLERLKRMKLNGISDLLRFLNRLDELALIYRFDRRRQDTIMVTITLVGIRVEVDFFDDHIEYSVFKGDEWVLDDQQDLFRLLNKDT